MRCRFFASVGILAAVIALGLVGPATLAGQAPTLPRTAWGAPDLQGVWDFRTLTPLERPKELAGKPFMTEAEAAEFEQRRLVEIGALDVKEPVDIVGNYNQFWFDRGTTIVGTRRTSLIIDPPDGRLPPLTPEAQRKVNSPEAEQLAEMRRGNTSIYADLDPGDRCIMHVMTGPPIGSGGYNQNMQLFQTPEYVAILSEQIHAARLIPLDGRPHVGPLNSQWLGDARGRWEGDTLIVETTNFNGKHDHPGRPLLTTSEHMSVVERFKRVDAETLMYEYTVTDPATWVRHWTAQLPMKRNPAKMYEYACHEGNYSMEVRLAGARALEKAAAEAAKKGSK